MQTRDFYGTVTQLCSQRGISITALAKELGISKSTPTDWKRKGAQPQTKTLKVIADYFSVSPAYLSGTTDDPIDYANLDTSNFNLSAYENFLKIHKGSVEQANRAYLEFEKAQAQDAMNDPARVAIYNQGTNNWAVGSNHAPVTIINGKETQLSDQEAEILRIFAGLSTMERAKVLIFASELKDTK